MGIINAIRSLFAREAFVRVTKGGEYIQNSHRRFFGKIYRWFFPGEYIYLSTLWKAHLVVNKLLVKMAEGSVNERQQGVTRLQALRDSLTNLSQVENRQLHDLLQRIDIAISKNRPSKEVVPSSPCTFAHDFIGLLLGRLKPCRSALATAIYLCKKEERQEAERLVVEQFFDPILIDACAVMAQKNLQEEAYQEALGRVKESYDLVASCFGPGALLNALTHREFDVYVRNNFLLPLFQQKIAKSGRRVGEIVDAVNELQKHVRDIAVLFQNWGDDEAWRAVQGECLGMLNSFFSHSHSFTTTRTPSSQDRLVALSSSYEGPDKNAINGWLLSLREAETVVTELSQQLLLGIYVGNEFITEDSLDPPFFLTQHDRRIFLCWQLYLKVVAYCSEHGLADGERRVSNLFVLASQDRSSHAFFSNLSYLAGKPLIPSKVPLRDLGQREGFAFLCTEHEPIVQVSRVYTRVDLPDHPGFFVNATLSSQRGESITKVETTPCVFSGEGLHIEVLQGEYRLRKDSVLSTLRSGALKNFPFTEPGMRAFIARIDTDLSQNTAETILSLRHLERMLLKEIPTNDFHCAKNSPSEMFLHKLRMVKERYFSKSDASFGKSLARQVTKLHKDKDVSLVEFLTLLDPWIIEVWRREASSEAVIEGFFSELKEEFPLHTQAFDKKARNVTHFINLYSEMMAERLALEKASKAALVVPSEKRSAKEHEDRELSKEIESRNYKLMTLLIGISSMYAERFPGLVENLFFELAFPLFLFQVKKELFANRAISEIAKIVLNYIFEIHRYLPNTRAPLVDKLLALIQMESPCSDFAKKLLNSMGRLLGEKIVQENPHQVDGLVFVNKFREKEMKLTKVLSRESAHEVCDGMRFTCGLQYGLAIAKQIEKISLKKFLMLVDKERSFAPEMFSQVMRGALHEFDQRADCAADLDAFCSEYVRWLLEKLDQSSLDEWMNDHFRIFLSTPLSPLLKTIVRGVIEAICKNHSHERADAFFERLSFYLVKEGRTTSLTPNDPEKIRTYLNFLDGILPDEIKKKMRENKTLSVFYKNWDDFDSSSVPIPQIQLEESFR